LLPTSTYRTEAFVDAALSLGVELIVASEIPSSLEKANPSGLVTIDLENPEIATEQIAEINRVNPIDHIMGVDDRTVVVAAAASARIGLESNPVSAVRAAGDKGLQRAALKAAEVPIPDFSEHTLSDSETSLALGLEFPVVLKPVSLSASRGVIRADKPDSFVLAWHRVSDILRKEWPDRTDHEHRVLVERFIPGREFALEGIIREGKLHVFTIFDKPDPLDGPFFEETIYLTPSNAASNVVVQVVDCVEAAVGALGLVCGPVHAEVRVNESGAWMIELAARPIGGRCSGVLDFWDGSSLERVLVADALGMLPEIPSLKAGARGVMMIPTPMKGRLKEVEGVEEAERIPGVRNLVMTVFPGQELVPLPEGARYLGFIFAEGSTPEEVDGILREAHRHLVVHYEDSD
jgi:D-alanine-D-alanine ligase-like ATP-grasp enzyme